MNSHQPKQTARLAGLLYLVLAITGAFGIMYIPTRIVVPLDAAATIKNILDQQVIVRLSMASYMVSQIIFVFLALALYRLFRDVDLKNARLMVSLVLVSVPIAFLTTLNHIIALDIAIHPAQDPLFLNVFSQNQLDTMAMFFLNLGNEAIAIAQIFWGLWLFPFGLLVIRCGFMAKWIGYLLIIAGCGYVANSATHFLLPGYASLVAPATAITGTLAELSAILWFLIKGIRENKPEVAATVRK